MASKKTLTWPIVTLLVGAVLALVSLPPSAKQWAPGLIRNTGFHFGLDLAGGTQLDFRISEAELDAQIAEATEELEAVKGTGNADLQYSVEQRLYALQGQKQNLVEAIRTVLERRINAMGVSESTITPSYIGGEKHLLVDCPGVVDVQECIATVGKTIALEFKEEFTEATEEFEQEVRGKAEAAFERIIQNGETLDIVGQDLSGELGIIYREKAGFFQDQLPEGLQPLWDSAPSSVPILAETTVPAPVQQADGTVESQEIPGIFIAQVIAPRTQTGRILNDAGQAFTYLQNEEENVTYTHKEEAGMDSIDSAIAEKIRSMSHGSIETVTDSAGQTHVLFLRQYIPGTRTMEASHILVSYQGAVSAAEDITRTKEEAQTKADDLLQQLKDGADFATLAREHSDGPSGEKGGSLGEFSDGVMTPAFEQVAFMLEEGKISPPVETQFGYHIIRSDKAPVQAESSASFDLLTIGGEDAQERATEIIQRLQNGDVQQMEEQVQVRSIFFSLLPTGWKDTQLDGKHFRSATVTLSPNTNLPVVQITFDNEGAELFGELTSNNIGKQIAIFVGGSLITAPTVQSAITDGVAIITNVGTIEEARTLAQDLNTGAIPAPIFLAGQRTVEATLGATALKTSIEAALIGILILMVYMIVVYRLLGLIANVALSIYAFIFFAFLKLPLFLISDSYIVLTLAGMAGIILSIGMAVDANVLIFERMKEELRKGKLLKTAVHTGFDRAWPSIRDGNISTFITCTILFLIGTSIIRGFAVTLGMGVLISMFTAIVVTRWLLRLIAETPLAKNTTLFCAPKQKDQE